MGGSILTNITAASADLSLMEKSKYASAAGSGRTIPLDRISSVAKWTGKVFGITGVVSSGYQTYLNYQKTGKLNYGDIAKVGFNTSLMLIKSNPAGLLFSTGVSILDASGGLDWLYNGLNTKIHHYIKQ